MNGVDKQDKVYQAIQQVEHPAIASPLVDLGMIRDISYSPDENTVSLTLVLPVMGIPQNVRDYMVNSLYQAAKSAGSELTNVSLAEMTDGERQVFFVKEKENWRGS